MALLFLLEFSPLSLFVYGFFQQLTFNRFRSKPFKGMM